MKAKGFTLVEIAIALVIVALLMGGAISALRANQIRASLSATRTALDEAKEATMYWAVVNKKLPCPAKSPSDGEEDRQGNVCAKRRGLVPWKTLGIQAQDGWNNRLSYVMTEKLGETISMFEPGTIQVKVRDSAGAATNLLSEASVAFAIWSHGENGHHAVSSQDTTIADRSDTNVDEDANSPNLGNGIVFARDMADNKETPGGEFDDMVVWGSRFVMIGRLLNAGQLP